MEFLTDMFLGAAAVGAAVYCAILSRRLQGLTTLDGDLGSAIAVLSRQVDSLGKALAKAQGGAAQAQSSLSDQVTRAEAAARKLELLVAALHDLPEPAVPSAAQSGAQPRAHRPQSAWPHTSGAEPAAPVASSGAAASGRRRLVRRRADTGGVA